MKNKHLKLSLVGPLVLAAFLGSGRAFADEMASSTSQDSLATTVSSSSTTEATKTTSTETGTEVGSTSSDNSSSAVVTDASSTEKASTSTREATDSGIVVPSDNITSSTTVTDTREVSSTDTTAEAERVTTTVSGNQLAIQYNDKIASDESVKFAVWSEVNGQDDLVWYDASATGAAYIDLSKHKSYGTYNVHTYSFKESQGSVGLSALTVTVPEPAVKTSIRKKDEESYEVTVTDVPETINQIAVPVWSEVNGQDDIVWYQATKLSSTSYQAIIPLSDHHYDLGHYAAHVYGQSSITGGLLGLAVTSGFDHVDSRPNATVSVVNYAENKTRFDVVLSGNASTKPVKAVNIAVWSEDKGQDDLKWYTPTVTNNQARVTVDIANHSNTSDSYNVHVYTDYEDGSRVGQVLGAYKITKPVVKNDVSTQLTDAGIAITLDSSQVSDYTQVRFAVWSEDKGQDDLVWYAADSKGQAIAPYTDHSGFGTYHVHTYLASNGQMIGLNASSLTIARPDVKVGIEKETDTTYVVTVGQVPAYLESVVIPVWSDAKGQDDLTWVAAQKQSNGEYKATVSLKDHQYDTGHYSLHVYGKSQLGQEMIGLAVTDGFTVQSSQTTHVQDPKIEVTAYDKANGKVTLSISEQADSKKIQTVRVAAWSEENQANLHWYSTNTITDGKAVVTVDEQYHKGLQGNYTIHTYIDFTDGTTKGFVVGNYELMKEYQSGIATIDYKGTGIYGVTVDGVKPNSNILYAVWSTEQGQDDIVWYQASVSGDKVTGLIDVSHHKGLGEYNVHVYQNDNGNMNFLTSTAFNVSQTNYDTPYYNQRDPRWSGRYYGAYSLGETGCVPTTLAMVFSSLKNTTVLPTTVADYLYNNTVEFNRGQYQGTSGRGILMASKQWGLEATTLGSKELVEQALQEGHHVLAAVQNDKFVLHGTHELVLKGYSNGMTYVYDPYTSANTGWYSVASLWSEQSTDWIDRDGIGAPFIQIKDTKTL